MKPAFANLTILAFLLGGMPGAHGQAKVSYRQTLILQEIDGKAASSDPFDLRNRRTLSPLEADLEVLKKHSLDTSNKALLDFFRKRTMADEDRAKVAALVEQLGSDRFRIREQATDEILKLGPAVLGFLGTGVKSPDLELARRRDACAERIRNTEPSADVVASAARVLAARHPPAMTAVMLAYLPYAANEFVADEIGAALRTTAQSNDQAHRELAAALSDSIAVRRAVAGEALAGREEHAQAVKKLLSDPEPLVRLRVARTLLLANDKSAMLALIEALPLLPSSQAWPGEDILLRLGEGRDAPALSRTGDEAARKKFVGAWTVWWANNEKQIDLAKLHETPKILGHTVVILLDLERELGRVMELNAKNEALWKIDGLILPLDVQPLANGNVLVAEYKANRVTERDTRGVIKWEKAVVGPLMARRLPNRHTFVASASQFTEFDEKGNETMSFSMPAGEQIMKVNKLPNGDIVCLMKDGRIVRMDEKGRELRSFDINLTHLSGGRIDVLPNGRVLVPYRLENKVVEFDAHGRIVWELTVPQPVAATRLPNGNTLVTTFLEQTGAIEFDPDGNETGWSFRDAQMTFKVTRALRR